MFDPLPEREPHAGCSNYHLNIVSRGRANLLRAFQITLTQHGKLVAYRIEHEWVKTPLDCHCPGRDEQRDRLTLFWSDTEAKNAMRLPYVLNTPEKAADFVWNWLEDANRGEKPDLDGSVSQDGWSFGSGDQGYEWQQACTITAIWAEHHK